MKKPVISEIYNSLLEQTEGSYIFKESRKDLGDINTLHDELREKLSQELLELHNRYVDAVEEYLSSAAELRFVEGFKLGLLIGIECMDN